MTHAASPARPRARVTRRALVGAAWTLAWTLVWACMLMMFASRARAAPLTLAVSSGPVSLPIQYFLDSWLVYNGIDPRSVTVVGMAPDKLAPALQARDVDAIAIWEPIASSAAMQSQARWAAHGTGATRAGVDLLQLIDPAPLRRVEAAAVGIVE